MDVLYTCDNNYVWLMGISVISLFENNYDIEDLTIYLIGEDITNDNKKALHNIAHKYYRKMIIIDAPVLPILTLVKSHRWPKNIIYRLFAGEILPSHVERILYIDSDTIINGNIKELWDICNDKIIYGVKDCVGVEYKKNLGMKKESEYINSGVLFINLSEYRNISIKDRVNDFINKYSKRLVYPDQDIINGIFEGEIGIIHPKYNVMTVVAKNTYQNLLRLRHPLNYYSQDAIEDAKRNPIIIHYTTNLLIERPWFLNSSHPCVDIFYKYMEISPWKEKQLEKMKYKTKESKILKILSFLPPKMYYEICGFLHSEIKPLFKRIK